MPVPGVPTLQPVDKPYMNPREAGKAAMATAGLAEDSASIASESLQLNTHIREAQKTVDKVAAANQYNAEFDNFQVELKKTQDSRAVEGVIKQHQDNLNEIAKRWGKSPASIEIQMQGDSLRPKMEMHGQLRQIDLMGKEWNAQTDLQIQTFLPQLVTAERSGDRQASEQIRSHVNGLYDDAVRKGLIGTDDKNLAMSAFDISARKQLNEASINSSNPAERQQAIAQLKSGGTGPLDLTNLASGDVSALRVHAEETNQRLNNLAEAGNLNKALNIVANAFQSPEFKNNFEAQQKALQDGEWLKQNGIVSEDGSPDRVMAEKLEAESTRQEGYRKKEQGDQDEKVVEKYSPLIDENKMSRAEIDALPDEQHGGISNRARSQMIRQWTENFHINRQLATMDRQEAARAQQEISDNNKLEFYQRITSGELVDPLEIRTSSGLTKTDKTQLLGAIQTAKTEPDFRGALSILNDAIPDSRPPKKATPEQQELFAKQHARQAEEYNETLSAYNQEMKDHPGQKKMEAMRKVLEPVNHKRISEFLDQRFGVTAPQVDSGSWLKRAPGESWTTWLQNRMGEQRPDKVTTPSKPTGATGKAMGKDGKMHWADATGKDYGVAE